MAPTITFLLTWTPAGGQTMLLWAFLNCCTLAIHCRVRAGTVEGDRPLLGRRSTGSRRLDRRNRRLEWHSNAVDGEDILNHSPNLAHLLFLLLLLCCRSICHHSLIDLLHVPKELGPLARWHHLSRLLGLGCQGFPGFDGLRFFWSENNFISLDLKHARINLLRQTCTACEERLL